MLSHSSTVAQPISSKTCVTRRGWVIVMVMMKPAILQECPLCCILFSFWTFNFSLRIGHLCREQHTELTRVLIWTQKCPLPVSAVCKITGHLMTSEHVVPLCPALGSAVLTEQWATSGGRVASLTFQSMSVKPVHRSKELKGTSGLFRPQGTV